jgi:putative endonuclease
MWYVYILLCADNSLYTGATNNIEKRFNDHVLGKGSAYTRSHKPLKILYTEQFSTKSEALKREIAIKKLSRVEKIASFTLRW